MTRTREFHRFLRTVVSLALAGMAGACGGRGAEPTPTVFPTVPPVTASATPAATPTDTVVHTIPVPEPASPIELNLTPERRLGRGQAFSSAWSPDAARLAVGTSVGAYVLDAVTLAPVQFLPTEGPVYVVAFDREGGVLAGGGVVQAADRADLGTVWVWDLASGQISSTITTGYWVNDLALAGGGTAGAGLLAVGGLFPTTTAQVWDLGNNEPLMTAAPGTGAAAVGASVALSPDGAQLALAGSAGGILLYDARTGELQRALTGPEGAVYDLAYGPGGTQLAAGGEAQVTLWEAGTGRLIHDLPACPKDAQASLGCGPVWRVAFGRDGQSLAFSGGGGVQVVATATGETLRSVPAGEGQDASLWSLGFTPDGSLRAADNHQMMALDAAGALGPGRALGDFTEAVQGLAFGPGGRLVASELSALRLWDVDTGQIVRAWPVAAEGKPALSPDGRQLASGACTQPGAGGVDCQGHRVVVWDVQSGAEVRALEAHTSTVSAVAYSPDGRWLASAGADAMVYLWDAATGVKVHALAGHTQPVASLAFAPDGQTLASGGYDNVVRLWDVASGAPRGTLSGSGAAVLAVAYSPDGALLASGSAVPDSQVRLWNTADGSLLAALPGHLGQVQALAFHPRGGWLVSGGGPAPTGPDDFTLRLWRLTPAGRLMAEGAELYHTLRPHNGAIFAVAFSPEGDRLASGSFDGTVQVWGGR